MTTGGGAAGHRALRPPALVAAWLIFALPAAVASPPRAATAAVDPAIESATGALRVLVHTSPGSWTKALGAARALGLSIGTRYRPIDVFVATGPKESFMDFAGSDAVQYLEANARLRLFTDSSHKATRGQPVLDGAVKLTGKTIDGRGVGVAVVDTGVDGTHPDLVQRMGGNVRFVCARPGLIIGSASECGGPKQALEVEDSDGPGLGGHGTHVTGIIAGDGKSSDGTYHGAAPGATIFGVGIGTVLLVENALDGLRWVLENHDNVKPRIRVVNNSWGGGYSRADPDDPGTGAITKLVNLLVEAGVTVVFAAGNGGGTGATPTTSVECVNPTPGVICVANFDDMNSGTRAGSINPTSSRGQKTAPDTWPDISAPGTEIMSTCRATLPVCNAFGNQQDPRTLYATMSGTSMAVPHVAGIIAQMYQVDPKLTPARVEDMIEDTAHKFKWGEKYTRDPFNRDDPSTFEKGHGLVDAFAVLRRLLHEL